MKKDIVCNGKTPQCPACHEELRMVLHGLVMEKYLKELKEKNIPFYNAGCMCYGDDRDASYYCGNCKKKFDDNLREIVLITCPRVIDYEIRKEECENNELLELKYSLYDERFLYGL